MRSSYVPVMHREKMTVTDMTFRQRTVTELLVRNFSGVIYERLPEAWNGIRPHRPKRRSRKQCPRSENLSELSFGIVRDKYRSTFWKKKSGNDRCSSLRSDAQQTSSCASWKTSEEENCHPSTWQREASHCTSELADDSKEQLGTALPSTLQSEFGPLRLPLVQALERSPERSPLRDWRGSPGSRANLVARSWNELLQQRHCKDSATLAEMHRSEWRFCSKIIKDT
jgi:hypothetical protein